MGGGRCERQEAAENQAETDRRTLGQLMESSFQKLGTGVGAFHRLLGPVPAKYIGSRPRVAGVGARGATAPGTSSAGFWPKLQIYQERDTSVIARRIHRGQEISAGARRTEIRRIGVLAPPHRALMSLIRPDR